MSEKSRLVTNVLKASSVLQNDLSGSEQLATDDTLIGFGCGLTPLLTADITPYAANNDATANRQMTT